MPSKLPLISDLLLEAPGMADLIAAHTRALFQGAYAVCRDWCTRPLLVGRAMKRFGLA